MEALIGTAIFVGIVLGAAVAVILLALHLFNFDALIEKVWNKKAEIANDNRRAAEASLEETRIKARTTHQ
jgi:hypothetical protein